MKNKRGLFEVIEVYYIGDKVVSFCQLDHHLMNYCNTKEVREDINLLYKELMDGDALNEVELRREIRENDFKWDE